MLTLVALLTLSGCNQERHDTLASLSSDEAYAVDRLTADSYTYLHHIRRQFDGSLVVITRQGETKVSYVLESDESMPDGIRVHVRGPGVAVGPHADSEKVFIRIDSHDT